MKQKRKGRGGLVPHLKQCAKVVKVARAKLVKATRQCLHDNLLTKLIEFTLLNVCNTRPSPLSECMTP